MSAYSQTNEKEWDARCKQCGRCCFEKLIDGHGRIIYTRIPCRYLDVTTRRCKIFPQRLTINPSCVKLTPQLLPTLNWLPPDCGYRSPAPEPTGQPERKPRRRR